MAKIHWSFYLILGAIILFASYRIDYKKFSLFIWLGYLFLVVGVAKLGIWFINSKKESPAERRNIREQASFYQGINPWASKQSAFQQMQRRFSRCPRCGLNLQGYENFCPRCGAYLRNARQWIPRENTPQRRMAHM